MILMPCGGSLIPIFLPSNNSVITKGGKAVWIEFGGYMVNLGWVTNIELDIDSITFDLPESAIKVKRKDVGDTEFLLLTNRVKSALKSA